VMQIREAMHEIACTRSRTSKLNGKTLHLTAVGGEVEIGPLRKRNMTTMMTRTADAVLSFHEGEYLGLRRS